MLFLRSLTSMVVFAGLLNGLFLVIPTTASAADKDNLTERERIMAEIDKDIHNDEAKRNAIRLGRERAVLCSHCHGKDGNSNKSEIPNIAAQNPAYIVEQIGKFASGERKNFVMQTLAGNFTFKDKVNLAVYYTSQKVKPVAADPNLAKRGERIYKNVCFRCHGPTGRGEEGYARLAGQKIGYVEMTLKRFRANANKTNGYRETARRNASMEQVTAHLSDEDIEGLAHYLASLR